MDMLRCNRETWTGRLGTGKFAAICVVVLLQFHFPVHNFPVFFPRQEQCCEIGGLKRSRQKSRVCEAPQKQTARGRDGANFGLFVSLCQERRRVPDRMRDAHATGCPFTTAASRRVADIVAVEVRIEQTAYLVTQSRKVFHPECIVTHVGGRTWYLNRKLTIQIV